MFQISCLQQIHSHDHVHGDIKLQNILMGLGDQSLTLFIVDFGLAKRYRHPATGNHIPFCQVHRMRGTSAFSSIHNHLGAELGHCDDLKSLAYMLIYLVCSSLPWLSEDKWQKVSSILEMKQKTAVEVLCRYVPCELGTFLTYTCTLLFSEQPDYSYVRSLFMSKPVLPNWELTKGESAIASGCQQHARAKKLRYIVWWWWSHEQKPTVFGNGFRHRLASVSTS